VSEPTRWTHRTDLGPFRLLPGAAFLLWGGFMLYTSFTHDFRDQRGVRTPGDARCVQIQTHVIGLFFAVLGLALALPGSGITIDRRKETVRVWSSVGPLRFGRRRPLAAYARVQIRKQGDRFQVSLAGSETPPLEFDEFRAHGHAFALAAEIAGVSGLPVEDPSAFAPAAPTNAQLNRALAVFQQFGPERSTPVEERWSRELPELPLAAYPDLLARCEEIEAAAAALAGQVREGTLGQDAGKVELSRQFPFLDPERLAHTWSQALYFAAGD
jgi:hypothetical protein